MHAKRHITTITDRGQVSIPADLRKELALSAGQRLFWEKSNDRELRIVILEDSPPKGARAMRGFARRFGVDPATTAEWMAELRAGEMPENDSE